MDQLAAIRTFIRIVETGSFTQAAQSLNLPRPTATKLIQELEVHLRAKLLNRSTRRLAVTADGAAYYERAVRLSEPFMKRVVANLDNDWTLHGDDIDAFLNGASATAGTGEGGRP